MKIFQSKIGILISIIGMWVVLTGGAGASGEDESGCSCDDDRSYRSSSSSESKSADTPSAKCQEFLDDERNASYKRGVKDGLAQAALEQKQKPVPVKPKLKEAPIAPKQATQKQIILVRNVKVKKGWWVEKYTNKYARKGANLQATFLCNGWILGTNKKVYPGDRIKICGFK